MQRRLAPVLAVALGVGLAVVPSTSAQAASSETSVSVQLRRTATSTPAAKGELLGVYLDKAGPAIAEDTFAVTGRLTDDSDPTGATGIADQRVHLFRQKRSQAAPVEVAPDKVVLTDDDGSYKFTAQPVVGTAAYFVTYDGATAEDGTIIYNGSESTDGGTIDPVVVFAMRDLNATKRKINGKLYFRGDVNPGWGGKRISLQRKTCSSCSWRTVASKAAGPGGGWSFQVGYPAKVGPVWRYQAVLAASGDFEKSYSAQLTTRRVYARDVSARLR